MYCLLFPQLVCALFDKKANIYGSIAGFAVAFILRFGGGDATLGIPVLIDYPVMDAVAEFKDGVRTTVLFPFRTLAMVSGLVSILVLSRVSRFFTQR